KPLLGEPAATPTPVGLLERAIALTRLEAKRTAVAAKAEPVRGGPGSASSPVRPADPADPVTVLPRVGEAVAKKLKKLK
ncbi:MAG TPA: hypothetical protein VER37_03935, partial [Thermomicrobiales bacterium]|nr:hypothetical protein [Thermomicrobiales bacterium]